MGTNKGKTAATMIVPDPKHVDTDPPGTRAVISVEPCLMGVRVAIGNTASDKVRYVDLTVDGAVKLIELIRDVIVSEGGGDCKVARPRVIA